MHPIKSGAHFTAMLALFMICAEVIEHVYVQVSLLNV